MHLQEHVSNGSWASKFLPVFHWEQGSNGLLVTPQVRHSQDSYKAYVKCL